MENEEITLWIDDTEYEGIDFSNPPKVNQSDLEKIRQVVEELLKI